MACCLLYIFYTMIKMKGWIFIVGFTISSFFFISNAQEITNTSYQTIQPGYSNAVDTVNSTKTGSSATKDLAEVETTTLKKKKHFIRKILSNYEGVDFRNAWSTLNRN
jgi:hypothetical protein